MKEQIQEQFQTVPFQPFSIQMNDGRSIEVPHADHLMVGRWAAIVQDDEGVIRILAYRNMTGLTIKPEA